MNDDIDIEDFEFSLAELDLDTANLSDFTLDLGNDSIETRYTKPILSVSKDKHVLYDNAVDLARATRIGPGERIDAVVSGNFIFGDYIGAYLQAYDIKVPEMTINTLSLSGDNILLLEDLMKNGYIDSLNLIVSHYFYQHNKNTLVPFIYEHLDNDENTFQFAVAGTHMKQVNFNTAGGKHIVIHGSANLRSSANIEQFTIEENKELYEFYDSLNKTILEKYSTINKALRRNALRDAIGIQATKTRNKRHGKQSK